MLNSKRTVNCLMGMAAVASFAAAPALFGQVSPPWSDDFEAYEVGSGIAGQGGWSAWDDDLTWDSFVTDAEAFSGEKSLDIVGDSDTTMVFEGVDDGCYVMSARQYIPTGYTGQSYFIMLNTYSHGGDKNWSVQVIFDAGTGLAEDVYTGATLPIIFDEWVEISVEIDLDNDTHTFFYGGQELFTDVWSRTGQTSIQALDLFANGATSVYYDDTSLRACGGTFELATDDTCPGSMTFETSGGTPDGFVGFVYAFGEGSVVIPGGQCAGTQLGLDGTARLGGTAQNDANGAASLTVDVPDGACGNVFVQAVDGGACTPSNVLAL